MEKYIRERYQRDGGPLGKNDEAIEKFVGMLQTHKESDSHTVQKIIDNIENIEIMAPNFTIFQSDRNGFMHQFNALNIDTESNIDKEAEKLVISHEFGHVLLGITSRNQNSEEKVQVPEGFEQIVKGARANCISPENKEIFRKFIEFISNSNETERTEAEKSLVSDIISSVFQYPALTFAKTEQTCVLPAYHNRDYWFDEENGKMKTNIIFDEQFANYYALVANNCDKELEKLETLLGEEWMKTMQEQLEKTEKIFEEPNRESKLNVMDKIKDATLEVRESEVPEQLIGIDRKVQNLETKEREE